MWFLCLMAYQPLWVTLCQSLTCRRTVVVLFHLQLGIRGFMPFPRVLVWKSTIVWLEFEIANYNVAVQHVRHYIIEDSYHLIWSHSIGAFWSAYEIFSQFSSIEMRVCWKVNDVTSAVDFFFTNEIKGLQHQEKKWVDHKRNYIDK